MLNTYSPNKILSENICSFSKSNFSFQCKDKFDFENEQNFIRKYLFIFKIKLIFALKRNSKTNKIWAKS
jgi:hypothetical protein